MRTPKVYKMSVLHTDTRLNHSSVVTDYETFVSVLQPSELKMVVEGTAETFASINLRPRPTARQAEVLITFKPGVKASDRISRLHI